MICYLQAYIVLCKTTPLRSHVSEKRAVPLIYFVFSSSFFTCILQDSLTFCRSFPSIFPFDITALICTVYPSPVVPLLQSRLRLASWSKWPASRRKGVIARFTPRVPEFSVKKREQQGARRVARDIAPPSVDFSPPAPLRFHSPHLSPPFIPSFPSKFFYF